MLRPILLCVSLLLLSSQLSISSSSTTTSRLTLPSIQRQPPAKSKSTDDGPDSNTPTTTASDTPQNASSSQQQSPEDDELAFRDLTMLIMEPLDQQNDDHFFKFTTVFENASFVGPFAHNPTNTSQLAKRIDDIDSSQWYSESVVNDRIHFQLRSNTDFQYAFQSPTISALPEAPVQLAVNKFLANPDTGVVSLTLVYNCVMGKPGRSVISMSLPVLPHRSITTAWTKDCGEGRFKQLQQSFRNHNGETVLFNPDGTYGTNEYKTLEVGPMDSSTVFYVTLKSPADKLDFHTPYAFTDSEDVSVDLRTTMTKGTFSTDLPTTFTVLYNCNGKSTANIKLTTAIPPWDNVTFSWRKDCGGSMSKALLIGTDGQDSYDIMQDGELTAAFQVSEYTTLQNVANDVTAIQPDVHNFKMYLTNGGDTSDIYFQTISTTLSNADVLDVYIWGSDAKSLPANGGVLQREGMRTLSLGFLCRKVGRSVILVTLPTQRYANVEFGFVKECDGPPKVYHHSGFLQTAESLMDVVLVLGLISGLALCVYTVRKRNEMKYMAVDTSSNP